MISLTLQIIAIPHRTESSMNHRYLLIGLLILSAGATAQKTSTVGLGATSCGKYTNLRASGDEDSAQFAGSYLQGYLSGVNAGMLAMQRPTKSIPDGPALLAFVDRFCRANPLERVDAALVALYMKLQ